MKNITQWKNINFESSSGLTPQFARFAREYKKAVRDALSDTFDLINYSRGHFYMSTFAKNKLTGKLIYICCSDVRYFPNEWYDHILIRTAKHERDYTGGSNNFTSLNDLFYSASKLTRT